MTIPTIDTVVERLRVEYQRTQEQPWVRKPLARALYNLWKEVDRQEPSRIGGKNVIDEEWWD